MTVLIDNTTDTCPLHTTASTHHDNDGPYLEMEKEKDVFHESMEQLAEDVSSQDEDCPSPENVISTSSSETYSSAQSTDDERFNVENDCADTCQERRESCSSQEIRKSVSWPESSVVVEVRFRPETLPEMKKKLFYSREDMLRFRKEYRIEMKAKKISMRQQQQQKKTQMTSPITGLINMVTSYMAMTTPTQRKTNSSSRSLSSPCRKKAGPLESHTSLLVDTLYLF